MSPFIGLLKSRKFWLLVLDTIVSILLFAFAQDEMVKFLVASIQPVFVFIILAIAYEDVGVAKATGMSPTEQVWKDKVDARQGEKAEARVAKDSKDK